VNRRARLRGATRALLSVGPGYEPQPQNPRASFEETRGYFLDLTAKTYGEGQILSAFGDDHSSSPTARAQRALGWFERALDSHAGGLARFLAESDALIGQASAANPDDGGSLLWAYPSDAPKYGLQAPWYSAMAQGQAASVLARAYLLTGDVRYASAAKAAVRPLTQRSHGLVIVTRFGVVLEEYPSNPPSLVLNGWIYGLWGLWDVWHVLGDQPAADLFATSVDALERALSAYDTGRWSLYSLLPVRGGDLAKPFYHRLHIDQLEVMARLTRRGAFAARSAIWRSYDSKAAAGRAIARKVWTALT
jgi:heparosan-N-sulfate-glucuronate 5-epimerase